MKSNKTSHEDRAFIYDLHRVHPVQTKIYFLLIVST